jgi:tRNA1(Val) A37 N6-methylase TrmN6
VSYKICVIFNNTPHSGTSVSLFLMGRHKHSTSRHHQSRTIETWIGPARAILCATSQLRYILNQTLFKELAELLKRISVCRGFNISQKNYLSYSKIDLCI